MVSNGIQYKMRVSLQLVYSDSRLFSMVSGTMVMVFSQDHGETYQLVICNMQFNVRTSLDAFHTSVDILYLRNE